MVCARRTDRPLACLASCLLLRAQVDVALSVCVHTYELYLDSLGHLLDPAAAEAELVRARNLLSAVASVLGPRHSACKLLELRVQLLVEINHIRVTCSMCPPGWLQSRTPPIYPNVYEDQKIGITLEAKGRIPHMWELRKVGRLMAADTLRWASRCVGRGRDGRALYQLGLTQGWPFLSLVMDRRAGKGL